jgi:RNA polymerase sigma-70 factor (ECF subfamily)
MTSNAESITRDLPPERTGLPDLDFEKVYEDTVEYIWNTVCRMGVRKPDVDDVVQEIFVVVFRKLPEFEGRAQLKTWIFEIMVHVVQHHFRTHARKPGDRAGEQGTEIESLVAHQDRGPAGELERVEALRVLDQLLLELDDAKRMVFVLAEIEQMTLPEIAQVLEANVNTVWTRLRAARRDFERALSRFHTRELERMP